jgi:uncharacterized cupin superfamily protein
LDELAFEADRELSIRSPELKLFTYFDIRQQREVDVTKKPGVIRLDASLALTAWQPMELTGELAQGAQPRERFHRVLETSLTSACALRAGVWEAEAYAEKVRDYPYDEIVFVVAGSVSIIDEDGNQERFDAGDGFFLQRGFNGYWQQHETLKIFHMTVAPDQIP